jgi:deazaflavin-dependent oxidoreductase (nitroreductase family)
MHDFNQRLIAEFRSNGGKVNGYFANTPLLLLTTTGAKSGQPRITPLAYTTDGDRLIIIASKGGAPTNPAWYHNLLAHPITTVEVGQERFQARAVVTEGAERDRLYTQMAEKMPGFAEYQNKTTRTIPVITLERIP